MAERFISFRPVTYPLCRLRHVEDKANPSAQPEHKGCFTTHDFDDRETFPDPIEHCTYITYENMTESFFGTLSTNDCVTDPCPEQKRILYCRCKIGDLRDSEEIALFKQRSGIDNNTNFFLRSETDIPSARVERCILTEAEKRFEELLELHNCNAQYDPNIGYMKGCQEIADTIRKTRLPGVVIESLKEPIEEPSEAPPIFTAASGKPTKAEREYHKSKSIPLAKEPPDEMIVKNPKDINSPVVEILQETNELLKKQNSLIEKNTLTRENDVFWGTHRANARCHEDVGEIEIEKVRRLRNDGWKWKDVIKEVYPDTKEEDIDHKVNAVSKQLKRDSESKKGII